MANGHGGYRRPSNPAPVSGPGALSRRTDGRPNVMDPGGLAYGEGKALHELQTSAPMGAGQPAPDVSGGQPAIDPSALTPLDAPGDHSQPITAGAPVGEGVGPEAIGLMGGDQEATADLEKLRPYLPAFIKQADRAETSEAFRRFVRRLRAELRA